MKIHITLELKPEGEGFQSKTRFARFFNLPELLSMFKMSADVQTAEMLNLPVPKADFQNVVAKPSDIQKEMVAELAERADAIRDGKVDATTDNMLCITNDGRKLALDQRIISPLLPDEPFSKMSICADNVYRIWEESKENRSTQLIFSDLSTPKPEKKSKTKAKTSADDIESDADETRTSADGAEVDADFDSEEADAERFSVYNDLREKLAAKGIPLEEIAFIHEYKTEAKKAELFAKVRKGKIRVLLGSTAKMGAGTNVQTKLIALHDLDAPWRPADLQQRAGLIVRQGNENDEVAIFRYICEGTFDSYMFQLLENKQRFISQIMTDKTPIRSMEDIDERALSYAEIKALATGNPYIIEKCQLEADVGKLKLLHANHLSQKYALESKIIGEYPKEIKRLTERIEGYKKDLETVNNNPAKKEGVKDYFPAITIGGKVFTDRIEAGKALIEACKVMTSVESRRIGQYRGFDMFLAFDSYAKSYRATLKGAISHDIPLGSDISGNITRLNNGLADFELAIKRLGVQLGETKTQLEAAKAEVNQPFSKEAEYKEKSERLKEVDALLHMDERVHEVLDDAPDEGDKEKDSEPTERRRGQDEREDER